MDRPQNTRLSCLCDTPCRFYLSVPANAWNIKFHRSLPTTRFAFGHRKSVRVWSPKGIRSRAWLRISQERNVRRFSCAVRVTRTDHDTCALPIFAISSHIRLYTLYITNICYLARLPHHGCKYKRVKIKIEDRIFETLFFLCSLFYFPTSYIL